MNVILPDSGKGPFATFYLLHGLSDDYSIWHRRTRIEMYVANLPLIVVMPDGYRGFYTNNNEGPSYFDYMTKDLPAYIERNFPAKRTRNGRCVGGLSMGGYGALRMGLGRPDMYASVNSHSGALLCGSTVSDIRKTAEFGRIFGSNPKGSEHDLIHLARRLKKAGKQLPAIRIDCGTEDFLLKENRTYRTELQKLGIAHQYEEFPGSHSWDYWDLHVREAIAFHAKALRLKAN
jgi:S-formylglutathione hydrolase FrmB